MSESALIKKSQAGSAEAFAKLVARYEDRIFRVASHVCAGLPQEAEDVFQDTFLTAYKKIGSFKGGSNLSTWLYRIAANLCWQRFRDKKRRAEVRVDDLPNAADAGPTPEEVAKKKELRAEVARVLGKLPVEYRLALVFRDVEGMSNEDAAAALGISVAAVKSRVHRARLFVRGELDKAFTA